MNEKLKDNSGEGSISRKQQALASHLSNLIWASKCTHLLYCLHDRQLNWLLHSHNSFDVLMLPFAVHRTPKHQLQHQAKLLCIASLHCTHTKSWFKNKNSYVGTDGYMTIRSRRLGTDHLGTGRLGIATSQPRYKMGKRCVDPLRRN